MAMGRRALLKGLAGAGATALGGTGLYSFYARRDVEITRAAVGVVKLPRALAGLRIGFLTDVHRSRWVSHDDVSRAVAMLMNEAPDFVVLGGDYVTWGDREYIQPAAEALAPLSAPFGVYGILGNHDDDHDMPAALAARGVQVLKDARTTVRIKGEAVDLVGIRFWTKRAPEIASIVRGGNGFPILLAHDPRRLKEAADLKIPLVLSGHTHGGQIVLPHVGAVAAAKFSPPVPVMAGIGSRNETTIFVSRGVGTVYVPMRINCPPEVAILTLKPAPSA
jgi:predicted MPP superfamily phosphohydrolase